MMKSFSLRSIECGWDLDDAGAKSAGTRACTVETVDGFGCATSNDGKDDVIVRVIASEKNWIEGVRLLERAAQMEGMRRAVGMPDLHVGRGCPIRATFLVCGLDLSCFCG